MSHHGEDEVISWIDLDRYPLQEPGTSAYRSMINEAQRQMASLGLAELSGFISPDAMDAFVTDAEELAKRSHASSGVGTPYLELPDEVSFGPAHPRRTWMPYGVKAVGYDVMPFSSRLRRLYESEAVRLLIEAIVDRGPVARYGDPFGALNLAVMGERDALQWHFDQTDFVVSLAIQTAQQGGDFEVAPKIRSVDDEAYDEVARVLEGSSDKVITLAMTPGTLLVFEGRHSLHRVTEVTGPTLRHVGLLAYDTTPGAMGSDLLREIRYGRTVPFATPPESWPVD